MMMLMMLSKGNGDGITEMGKRGPRTAVMRACGSWFIWFTHTAVRIPNTVLWNSNWLSTQSWTQTTQHEARPPTLQTRAYENESATIDK